MNKILYLPVLLPLIFALNFFAQQNTTTINNTTIGERLIVHKIEKGETIFSICRKYNCEQNELVAANPQLKNGLKTGETLKIPVPVLYKPQTTAVTKPEFIDHIVKRGETAYSISKLYNITVEAIIQYNPETKQGVKENQIIRIPYPVVGVKPEEKPIVAKEQIEKIDLFLHEVEQGDTYYSYQRRFGVSKEQLIELNPNLQDGLQVGETLKIPSVKINETETAIDNEKVTKNMPVNYSKKESIDNSKDTFRITMFLPLFLDANDSINLSAINSEEESLTDSTQNPDTDAQTPSSYISERSLYGKSRDFLCFYEGFLIALDTMKKTGINIRLDIYDNKNKLTVIDSIIRHTDIQNSDLIIGPVEIKLQKNISSYSIKNHITMVSPFSSDDDYTLNNPFYFQVNPTKDYVLRKTADFIGKEYYNKNVIVMIPGSYEQIIGADLIETVHEKMKYYASKRGNSQIHFTKVNINEVANQEYWQIKEKLNPDSENVIFIPLSSNRGEREAILSKAINSLYVLSDEYPITLIGTSDFPVFKSINTEYFHKLNLHFVTPNFIDYNDVEVNSFLRNYRVKFLTEPNQYSFRGYDIAKFFAEAYRQKGSNFMRKISSFNTHTLQSNFKPKRLKEMAGFMNSSLFVVNFTPDYDVKAVAIISDF